MPHELQNVTYWTYGDQSKPTCLLIHGFTGSHEGFQYIVPLLTEYHVIVPDLPGCGISKLPDQPWNLEHIAELTNQFVTALGLTQPPYLVSHSMGTLVAAEMIRQRPELFHEKTVFVSPVASKVTRMDSRMLGVAGMQLHYSLGVKAPKIGGRIVRSKRISTLSTKLIWTTKDKELQKRIDAHHIDNLDYISSIDYYRKLHKDITARGLADYADDLSGFDILVINGDKDRVTPLRILKKIREKISFKLEVIENVGHLAHYETPDRIARSLRNFLR